MSLGVIDTGEFSCLLPDALTKAAPKDGSCSWLIRLCCHGYIAVTAAEIADPCTGVTSGTRGNPHGNVLGGGDRIEHVTPHCGCTIAHGNGKGLVPGVCKGIPADVGHHV